MSAETKPIPERAELYDAACNVEEFLRRVTAWEGSDEEELGETIEAAEKLTGSLEPSNA